MSNNSIRDCTLEEVTKKSLDNRRMPLPSQMKIKEDRVEAVLLEDFKIQTATSQSRIANTTPIHTELMA